MIEALFIFGLLGLLVGATAEWMLAHPAFATFMAGFVFIPFFTWQQFLALAVRVDLPPLAVRARRAPTPPEEFYWPLRRTALFRDFVLCAPLLVFGWIAAAMYPAQLELTTPSAAGWALGAVAIFASAHFLAAASVYCKASQWHDPMRPAPAGWYRKLMFWLSEDAAFLGRLRREGAAREKAIY